MKNVKAKIGNVVNYVKDGVWEADVAALGRPKRCGVQGLRLLTKTLGSFLENRCGLHAAGLTYFSMMAVIPVLCLLLLLARTCGVGDLAREKVNGQLDAFITNIEKGQEEAPPYLAFLSKGQTPEAQEAKRESARELAVKAREISDGLFDKIDQFNVGTLGLVGTLMLLWTVVSTFGMVEGSFNEIWKVEKGRSLPLRFVSYAFVALVLPILVTLAMSMPILRIVKDVLDATLGATSYTKWVGDALVAVLDSRLFGFCFTLLFSALASAFILWFMPHRRVKFRAAFEGGLFTALLLGGWMKLCAVAQVGVAKSSALYGSFAFLPIVLAWIYMSWQIVLLGSSFTYALQCVHSRVRDLPCK